jgi:SagB-type dehydrogenase family enzyme
MTPIIRNGLLILAGAALVFFAARARENYKSGGGKIMEISLPAPSRTGSLSIESALAKRRSVRSFSDEPLSMADLSQLLWSAQGITGPGGFRTAPSAGALYPLEVFVSAGHIANLPPGIYRYIPARHALQLIDKGDIRNSLARAALGQPCVSDAPAAIVIAAVYSRVTIKYRARGERYVHMEAGHAAQNICLQAVALGAGTVVIGAFDDNAVKRVMKMEKDEEPLYIMPVGKPGR